MQQTLLLKLRKNFLARFLKFHALVLACVFIEPAIFFQNNLERQIVLAPPFDIYFIAKGANHNNSCSKILINFFVFHYFYFLAENRYCCSFSNQVFVARIVRMDEQADTRRQQLRPRSCNFDFFFFCLEINII